MMTPGKESVQGDAPGGLALMRELFASLPSGVAYVAGPDLVFEFANEEYRRIVGWRDLIGIPLRAALPEVEHDRHELLERAADGGQPVRGGESAVLVRREGGESEQLYVDFVYQPVRDAADQVTGLLLFGNDVTEHVRDRRRLEVLAERLAVTEERYRTLFETLPLGVIHYNADGTILGANAAAGEILGLPPESIISWPLDQSGHAVHEDGSPWTLDEYPVLVALRTGQIVADQVAGLPHPRTGEMQWLRITAVPDARDARGRPQRAYAMLTDITDQRRAEATSRESSRLLGRLREANVLGVVVSDENGVQEANDAYLDIIGYSRADLAAGRVAWRAITPPKWAANDDSAVAQLRRAGACRPFEKEYTHRDGHRVPVLVGAAVIDWNPLRWVTFAVDLTARQRGEQERAALLGREQAARREADTARERLAFLQRTGDPSASSRNRDALAERVTHLLELAGTANDEDLDLDLDIRDGPDSSQIQEALRTLNARLDERVSERTSQLVRAEADRRALENELQQAERLQTVGQLTSGIAHDFGNLLGVVVAYAEMAEEFSEQADPELLRILGEIRAAADRAVSLTGDLLSFSHRTRSEPGPVDLSALVAGLTDLLSVSLNGSAEVVIRPWPAALPPVLADRGELEHVLLNLAVNARDAMPEGGTLTISTSPAGLHRGHALARPRITTARYVELAVSDTGTGMSPDVAAHIFERFFTTKPPGKGTGLGLSTVHGIISRLGGTIEVDSREGDGTTFSIFLPARPDLAS
jgi:two-component system cell cycle sensor histidine kinase/response regulator CckA